MRQHFKVQCFMFSFIAFIMACPLSAACSRCCPQDDTEYYEYYEEPVGGGDECNRCRPTYNPMIRYYPYCSIYQQSRVRESIDDEVSWPSRRDEDLVDELTR